MGRKKKSSSRVVEKNSRFEGPAVDYAYQLGIIVSDEDLEEYDSYDDLVLEVLDTIDKCPDDHPQLAEEMVEWYNNEVETRGLVDASYEEIGEAVTINDSDEYSEEREEGEEKEVIPTNVAEQEDKLKQDLGGEQLSGGSSRIFVDGKGLCSFIRELAREGKTKKEVASILDAKGVVYSKNTLDTQYYRGTKGRM